MINPYFYNLPLVFILHNAIQVYLICHTGVLDGLTVWYSCGVLARIILDYKIPLRCIAFTLILRFTRNPTSPKSQLFVNLVCCALFSIFSFQWDVIANFSVYFNHWCHSYAASFVPMDLFVQLTLWRNLSLGTLLCWIS